MVLQIYGYGKTSPRAPSITGSNPSVRDGKNEEERTNRVRREDWMMMMMMMERDKTGNGLWRSGDLHILFEKVRGLTGARLKRREKGETMSDLRDGSSRVHGHHIPNTAYIHDIQPFDLTRPD